MEKIVNYIVGGLVVLIVASVLLPIGLNQLHSANTTGWSSSETTIFTIFGVLIMVGILIGIVYAAVKVKGK
jgi:uncharacterized membrane protein